MTAKSTRRAVLAGAAALPALSLPAIASEHPDAELIALGRQVDGLQAQFEAAVNRWRPQWDAMDAAMKALDKSRRYTNEEIMAVMDRVEQEYPVSGPHPDDIMDMTAGPSDRIVELRAHTIQGLAVKARLAKFAASEPWKNPKEDLNWDQLATRQAIDAVIDLAAREA